MKGFFSSSAALCLVLTGVIFTVPAVSAQDQAAGMLSPPKVLEIIVEGLKPGQGGSPHIKSESAFVQAFKAADWTTHYLGMDALSGPSRAVFFAPYDSFDAWQKDLNATAANPTFSAAIDSATVADGALLNSYETSAYLFRDDLSLRAPVPGDHFHYVEIQLFRIRPGHDKDWDDLVKMYIAAFQKIPNAHWATFQKIYGTESGSRFIAVTPMKSMAEADQELLDGQAFEKAAGEEQLKKMSELIAATVESSESNIYAVNPKMSYPSDTWVKADPKFWNQQ
jgi:hypothetical protein